MEMTGEPLVWERFSVEKDGKTLQIRLQQLLPDLVEPCLDHLVQYFLTREPLTSHSGLSSDPVSLEEMKHIWRETLKDNAGIVAIVENEPNAPPHNIVALNATGISKKEKFSHEWQGKLFIRLIESVLGITEEGNLFERYGVDRYLTAMGLSVHPDYHGLGLGLKLLQAREKICKSFNLKLTATVFTAAASQHLASKAGFQVVAEKVYKTYELNGKVNFPNLEGKMLLMAKVYD